jgi:hypothetical protein
VWSKSPLDRKRPRQRGRGDVAAAEAKAADTREAAAAQITADTREAGQQRLM